MKKSLLISIVTLAAALISCTKVEPDAPSAPASSTAQAAPSSSTDATDNQKIDFNAVLHSQQTKAGTDDLSDFITYAFYTGSYNWNDLRLSDMVKYINGETVSKNGSTWKPANDYFWPKSGKLSFASYAPASAGLTISEGSKGDLLYKTGYANNGSDDLLIALSENKTRDNSQDGVAVSFRHALSQVCFKARASSLSANGLGFEIKIKSISVANVFNTADLTWDSTKWDSQNDDYGIVWSNRSAGSLPVVFYSNDSGLTLDTTDPESILGGRTVIPQNLTGRGGTLSDVTLSVTFELITKNASTGTTLDDTDITETVTLGTGTISTWAVNHSYTYIIIVNPLSDQTITFAPEVEEWKRTLIL